MKKLKFLAVLLIGVLASSAVAAQVVGIGTTKGGATAQVSAGIAKIVSEHAGFQMRPQPMAGTQQYIPIVNDGELEFGIANMMQTYMAKTGTGLSEGQANDNLRMVATMMMFQAGLIVAKNSGIDSVADLKGKKVPSGFKAAPLFGHLLTGMLATGGVEWDDVDRVPVSSGRQMFDALKQGKTDVSIAAVGSGVLSELDAAIRGGIKFISFSDDDAAVLGLLKSAPKTFIHGVKADGKLVAIEGDVNVLGFDYALWANKDVDEDIVYGVTKAMYEHESELHGLAPLWSSHASATMSKDQGAELAYHPGAIKFFKEVGTWPGPASN